MRSELRRVEFSGGVETSSRVFDPETWEGSGAAHIISTHKSARHFWQIV
jgi:hypothetical protein